MSKSKKYSKFSSCKTYKIHNKIHTNFNVYVVRTTKNNDLKDSAPCKDCYEVMLNIGVKYIIYSNNDETITKIKLIEYIPKTISLGKQFIQNNYTPVKREQSYLKYI